MKTLLKIYEYLFASYGPQGWWPISSVDTHKGEYGRPLKQEERFEIAVGAILTQNTNWGNVEKALKNLHHQQVLSAPTMAKLPLEDLQDLIHPAGYYNQKAKKLKIFTEFFLNIPNGASPTREELLGLWGIGPETADSILLYAFFKPSFVVDAYTRRIFSFLGLIPEKSSYQEIKNFFEDHLPLDPILFQEYHALIVGHAKRYYTQRPYGKNCPLPQLL